MAVSQSSSVIGHIRIIGDEWTDDNFHHMAYTRQGTTMRGYRDGIKVYEVITVAIANMFNNELLRAGRSPPGSKNQNVSCRLRSVVRQ